MRRLELKFDGLAKALVFFWRFLERPDIVLSKGDLVALV